jgi:hypothetical protein
LFVDRRTSTTSPQKASSGAGHRSVMVTQWVVFVVDPNPSRRSANVDDEVGDVVTSVTGWRLLDESSRGVLDAGAPR